ncbi:MAG: EAL domain-containing protein [Algicola sp.]|nr:EAL domain-containing protein [Algicola sp.]
MGWLQQDKGATVLIADDDESQLMLLEQTLLINQFAVIAVRNGLEAVEAFIKHRPDIVLLDVDMPQMDGFTACDLMRSQFPELTVPIVMVTGMDDVESIEKAYAVGADDFIVKPISWPILGHRVFYYLKGSRALSEIKERNEREKTLFSAIPDIVIQFDETFNAKDIHTGRQQHLFTDNCPDTGNLEGCALVLMVKALLKVQFGGQSGSLGRQQFEESLWLNGKLNHIEIRIAASQNNEVIVVLRDISERKANEQRILNLVMYDQLTGLPNRRYLEDELDRCLTASNPNGDKVALLFANIDRFSKIYESFGLKVGDQLMVKVGQRMKEGLRHIFQGEHGASPGHYRLSRFSENEFAIMLTHLSDSNEAFRIAQLMQDMVADSFDIEHHEIYISLSVGIAFFPDDSSDSVKLIEMAGQAANLAKQSGDHISCYSASFNEQAQRKLQIERNLRKALEKDEFHLVFQPKLCVDDPSILSAEVLLRWTNEELGFVSPGEFIPIAEQDEVILDISRWIVEKACQLNARLYHDLGLDVTLAINLSPQQFTHQQNLVNFFAEQVSNVDMTPANFELEITENVLIDDVDYTSKQLNQLREMGFYLAIDDFGTGYSSLSYLTRFNIDTLKIDQSFINTFDDPRSQKLIETLIVMGKKLNMKIVAEGVETTEQLAFLKRNHCDYVQGYIYARPLVFDDFVAFLQR